jgi:hypothetical protein
LPKYQNSWYYCLIAAEFHLYIVEVRLTQLLCPSFHCWHLRIYKYYADEIQIYIYTRYSCSEQFKMLRPITESISPENIPWRISSTLNSEHKFYTRFYYHQVIIFINFKMLKNKSSFMFWWCKLLNSVTDWPWLYMTMTIEMTCD